jgi:carboxypeptidase Taq
MSPRESYDWLRAHSVQTAYLASAAELLAWDQRTCLPPGGHAHRAGQMAAMARLLHERSTDPRLGEHLTRVEGTDLVACPTDPEAVNLREWRRDFDRSVRIPERLAVELARASTAGESAWEAARPAGDWEGFRPFLERICDLQRHKAEALGFDGEPYDALVDEFEPGETASGLAALFDGLRGKLVPLVAEAGAADPGLPPGRFPAADQDLLCREVAALLGYDFGAGRLDAAAHPFTAGIGPGDARITNRFDETSVVPALLGTIHEVGHALYEQGLPREHWGTPAGEPASLGIHESQSRLWENMVGRSAGFWAHALPLCARRFPALDGLEVERFVRSLNAVTPSLIRVEADEVTYNLHIIVRFELERALISGELPVADLPGAWNEKMRAVLGVTPTGPADGVLQDVHWPSGLFGYFPTYTLGNLYAAQLFAEAEEELGGLEDRFARGEFGPLGEWLRDNVHRAGGTFRPRELIREITGSGPDPAWLIEHLRARYGPASGS